MPDKPCPYCGHTQPSPNADRCGNCFGLFEPLSRQATQLAMGPWFVRDEDRPFMPGFSSAILQQQVAAGRVKPATVVRGPSTNQFWMRADQTPGLSRLLGKCHACGNAVSPDSDTCSSCNVDLSLPEEVDRLGLAFVDPDARRQAQQEVNAGKVTTPKPAPPKPIKAEKPQMGKPTEVDPGLMKPVDQTAQAQPDEQPATQYVYQPDAPADAPTANDIAEDLWHGEAASRPRPRRRKRKGTDPLIVVLGVMLFCLVGVVLFLVLTDGGKLLAGGEDNDASQQQGPEPKSKAQVAAASVPVMTVYDRVKEAGVPDTFKDRFDKVARLVEEADHLEKTDKYGEAYVSYQEAKALLTPLAEEISAYRDKAEEREAYEQLLNTVSELKDKAWSGWGVNWSPSAFAEANSAWDEADLLAVRGQLDAASDSLEEAQAMYQMVLGHVEAGKAATQALEDLKATMKGSPGEQTLRRYAANLMDDFESNREAGDQAMTDRRYPFAEQCYYDAAAALKEAAQVVELARFRKYYAFDAGYRAAGMLLSIAAGDVVEAGPREQVFEGYKRLLLADNPASALSAGDAADYAEASTLLVHNARDQITQMHGEQVQACYHAGFQARIIEQTLASTAYTLTQKNRVEDSLNVLQEQAAAANWDTPKFNATIERIQRINQETGLGAAPLRAREMWSVVAKTLLQQDTALRLMDPELWPSDTGDVELFPG